MPPRFVGEVSSVHSQWLVIPPGTLLLKKQTKFFPPSPVTTISQHTFQASLSFVRK